MDNLWLRVSLLLACCLVQFGPVLPAQASLHDNQPRHLHYDGEDDLRSETDTCREEYNYKYPHECKVEKDCVFVVKWHVLEEEEGSGEEEEKEECWVQFDVTASLAGIAVNESSPVWVALGFSSDSTMGDTDVAICWREGEDDYSLHDGYNTPGGHKFKMDDDSATSSNQLQLIRESTFVLDDQFHCRFRRQLVSTDYNEDRSLQQLQYVLVAVGTLQVEEEGQSSVSKHAHAAASQCACNVTACEHACTCPGGLLYQMLKLHGIVMSICFMVLLPVGSVVSRYYKAVFMKAWFKAHVTTMVIGVLWSMVGLGLILAHTRGTFSVGVHQVLGLLCLGMVVLQPTMGFLRPDNKPTVRRKLFNIFHKSMAVAILLSTSTVVLFWGVYLYHNSVLAYMYAVLCLYILLNVGFVVLLEILKRVHKFSSSPPVGYHKVIRQDDLTSEEEEEVYVKEEDTSTSKGPAYTFEKGLLLLFVVQNLILCGLIGTFIFYFDAESD